MVDARLLVQVITAEIDNGSVIVATSSGVDPVSP